MEKQPKLKSVIGKKRKRVLSDIVTPSEPKTKKLESPTKQKDVIVAITPSPNKKLKKKKKKVTTTVSEPAKTVKTVVAPPLKQTMTVQKTQPSGGMFKELTIEEIGLTYPILNNKELVNRFLKVPLNNNQKGRIRQAIKAQLEGSDKTISADIVHGKIQAILKGSENLTDSDLRRLRILYNMLKTTLEPKKVKTELTKKVVKAKKEKVQNEDKPKKEKGKEEIVNKVKGPKRYVVFLGNLPLNVDKDKLMKHFAEIDENIKDIRIPKQPEGKKSAIAFMELANEPTYEMALSKHHSMLDNKRINVTYTAQQNSKVTKSEAKGKAAKLIALQKSGKLAGSIAVNKKRSHRRNIMKKARAKETAKENA